MSKEDEYDKVKLEQFKASSALEGLPTEQGISPNNWVIIEVNHEGKQIQKILSGWSGGYLHGDNWRLSSPIKEIDIDSEWITATTESGSTYRLLKESVETAYLRG